MSVRTYEQISDLPQGITPVSGTELVELEQNGVSRKFTMTELGGITAAHQGTHQFSGSDPIGTHDQVANAIPYLNADGKIDDHVSDASTTAKGKIQLATDGGTTAGTAVQANDGRLSNARAPTGHASTHYGVGDDLIPNATAEASGLMSNADKTKLDNQLPTADEKAALAGVGGTPSGSNKYVTDADGRLPTTGEKAALAGSYGTPGSANKYVTETDPILGGSAADITGIENWASFFRMFGAPEKIYDWSEVGSGVLACGAFYKGTLFCVTNGGTIYKQNANGTFSEYQELPSLGANTMFTDGTNFYIAEKPGDIYKMDGSGVFQATGQTVRAWNRLCIYKSVLYATIELGGVYWMNSTGIMIDTGCSASDGIDKMFRDMFTDDTYFYSVDALSSDIYSFANKTPSINIPAVGTLPIPSTFPVGGRKVIRRLSAYDGNAITITPPSGATIEGRGRYKLFGQYDSVTIERISATLFAIVDSDWQLVTTETTTGVKNIDLSWAKEVRVVLKNVQGIPGATTITHIAGIATIEVSFYFVASGTVYTGGALVSVSNSVITSMYSYDWISYAFGSVEIYAK